MIVQKEIRTRLGKLYTYWIDKEFEEVHDQYSWHICVNSKKYNVFYVSRTNSKTERELIGRYSTLLHKQVYEYFNAAVPEGKVLDHIDRNKMNCTKQNIRLATVHINANNRRTNSQENGFKHGYGFYWCKKNNRFVVRQAIHPKVKWIGSFKTEEEAIAVCLL